MPHLGSPTIAPTAAPCRRTRTRARSITLTATDAVVSKKKQWTLKAGLGGFDINKKGTAAGKRKVPESLGIVVGTMHMICVILFQVAIFLAAAADLSDSRPVV